MIGLYGIRAFTTRVGNLGYNIPYLLRGFIRDP